MQLALGTVQFGLAYGVAGRGQPVPEPEVRQILQRAWQLGIRWLDTAAAYGDIEARLRALGGDLPFRIVTKLPAMPAMPPTDTPRWLAQALCGARDRLGERLAAMMFHRAEDLAHDAAAPWWQQCSAWAGEHGVALGVSGYDPATIDALAARFPLACAQLPANALDQRVRASALGPRPELHLRSAFLQGLLLMPEAQAAERVPAAAAALRRFHQWRQARQLSALQACLAVVRSLPGASLCVVGVDSLAQLEQIAEAWQATSPVAAPELACGDPEAIDPRRWTAPR